jgi:hypothetical protein
VGTVTRRGRTDLERLTARVKRLEVSASESRRLNQRLCDVIDVVTEVLVPATDPEDGRLVEALARLSRTLGDGPTPAPRDQRSL